MERVRFIDPFAAEEPLAADPAQNLRPVPVPRRKPATTSTALPSRGREREVQQLIHDLAVLAASKQSAK